MPENIIAKKLNLELDVINQKVKVIKDFVVIVGDSVEITINLKENNVPKNITNCTCRLIGIKENSDPFEQTEKIEIIDALNGVVKIYPRIDIFNVEGKTICCLLVEDADETISVQRFIIVVGKSLESNVIESGKAEIETLKRLNETLDKYQNDMAMFSGKINKTNQDIVALTQSVENTILETNSKMDSVANNVNSGLLNMNDKIDNQVLIANNKFNELNLTIDEEFVDIENRLNNVNDTINTQLSKIIKLKPIEITGTSFMYFATETINESADNLLKKSYMLHISGMLDSATYNSSNVIINFFKQNGKIYINTVVLSDRIVNSRSISPSVIFDNLTNEILPTATGFRILVRSNITKALNTEHTTKCCLTPLSI